MDNDSTATTKIIDFRLSILERLPTELIHYIVSIGTCETALALSKVCKNLREACDNQLVYKAIIDNRNGREGPRWQHNLPCSNESLWARYAFADFKCQSCVLEKALTWAPQLVAHHRPYSSQRRQLPPYMIDKLILYRSHVRR